MLTNISMLKARVIILGEAQVAQVPSVRLLLTPSGSLGRITSQAT